MFFLMKSNNININGFINFLFSFEIIFLKGESDTLMYSMILVFRLKKGTANVRTLNFVGNANEFTSFKVCKHFRF